MEKIQRAIADLNSMILSQIFTEHPIQVHKEKLWLKIWSENLKDTERNHIKYEILLYEKIKLLL